MKTGKLTVAILTILVGPQAVAQSDQANTNERLVQQYVRANAELEAKKKIVLQYLRSTDDPEAQSKLLSDEYVEHNPRIREVEDVIKVYGDEGWLKAMIRTAGGRGLTDPDFVPDPNATPVAVVAEGDLVVVIRKAILRNPEAPSKTYEAFAFEMFVVQGGKITHHWDGVKLK